MKSPAGITPGKPCLKPERGQLSKPRLRAEAAAALSRHGKVPIFSGNIRARERASSTQAASTHEPSGRTLSRHSASISSNSKRRFILQIWQAMLLQQCPELRANQASPKGVNGVTRGCPQRPVVQHRISSWYFKGSGLGVGSTTWRRGSPIAHPHAQTHHEARAIPHTN